MRSTLALLCVVGCGSSWLTAKEKPVELPKVVVSEGKPVRLGFTIFQATKAHSPILVRRVDDQGVAARCGLKPGDVVTAINQTPATELSRDQVADSFALSPGGQVRLDIKTGR